MRGPDAHVAVGSLEGLAQRGHQAIGDQPGELRLVQQADVVDGDPQAAQPHDAVPALEQRRGGAPERAREPRERPVEPPACGRER